jgi:Tol biopolymer transport system component
MRKTLIASVLILALSPMTAFAREVPGTLYYTRCAGEQGKASNTCAGEAEPPTVPIPDSQPPPDTLPELFSKVAGSEPVRLTEDEDDEFGGLASPDGKSLAISVGDFDTCRLNVLDIEDGSLSPITDDRDGLCPFATDWSPDGKWVVFSWYASEGGSNINIAPVDGSGSKAVTSTFGEASFASDGSWVAGDRIVFRHSGRRGGQIYSIEPDGSDQRLLASTPASLPSLIRSPDRQQIAWTNDDWSGKGKGEVFVADADGSNIRQLTDNETDETGCRGRPTASGSRSGGEASITSRASA